MIEICPECPLLILKYDLGKAGSIHFGENRTNYREKEMLLSDPGQGSFCHLSKVDDFDGKTNGGP